MLARFAASGGTTQYADIAIVDSGAALGGNAITFADILPNDVVLMFVGYMPGVSNTHTIPSGYTEGGGGFITDPGQDYKYSWHYKVMGSAPDTGINLNDSNADGSGFVYYVCRNVDTSNPILTSTSTATENPGSITTTIKSVAFAAVFGADATGPTWTAPPSGYSGFNTYDASAFNDIGGAGAYKVLTNPTTEDPGLFTRSAAFSAYTSVTVALKPALAVPSIGTIPTFVSSSANSAAGDVTVAVPAGIQNGDLIVAIGITDGDQHDTLRALPSGFKLLAQKQTRGVYIATKVASSESGSYLFDAGSVTGHVVCLLAYRGATRVNTIGDISTTTTSATSVATSIYPTYRGVLVAAYGGAVSRTVTTPPSGMTQTTILSTTVGSIATYELSPQEKATGSDKTLVWDSSVASGLNALQLLVSAEPDVTPTFIDSASNSVGTNATTFIIPKPANTAAGDLMIAFMMTDTNGRTWTGDTGWTEVADQGVDPGIRIAYKVANTSEGSSYTFTASGSQRRTGAILTYRNAAGPVVAGSFKTGSTPLLPQSPNVLFSQSIILSIAARSVASNTVTTSTLGLTTRITDNDANDPSYAIFEQLGVPRGYNGFKSFTVGSTLSVSAISIAISPSGSI